MKIQTQKITLFTSVIPTKAKIETLTINEYFQGILTGRWQDQVLNYRAGKTDKQNIFSVTASGLFAGRKDSDLREHSGLIAIDIDAKDQERQVSEIRDELRELAEVFAIHSSLGGKGLAVYFRISKSKHDQSFEAIVQMLSNDYGVIPDLHCRNVGRLRFVSFDPDLYLNIGASVWSQFLVKKDIKENEFNYHVYSEHDIEYIMTQIKARQLNIATDYYSWLRIGFALASKLGEAGRGYYKIISSYYTGKQKINIDKQFDRCLRSEDSKGGRTSIKSFFYYAKLAGCKIVSERTARVKTVAKIRRKQEQSGGSGALKDGKASAREYLKKEEKIEGSDVDSILDQVWSVPSSELFKDDKENLVDDLEVFLKSNYKIKINEVTGRIEVNGKQITDYILNSIYRKALKSVSDKLQKGLLASLLESDFAPRYNPLTDWFESHKIIKKKGNIKKLAECIESPIRYNDPKFVEDFLEKWLLGIVASAYGTFSLLCLVLTGAKHGTGKTTFFRELLPIELRPYFAQSKLDAKEADIAQIMCSKILVLDDEFGGKSKSDEKKFKDLISKDVFTVRMPYGRHTEDKVRLAVLCGTSNDEHVLNDITGNRRTIPISITRIDEKKFKEIDKTALFSELYHKFKADPEGWFLNQDDILRLNSETIDAQQVAPEMELPLKYYEIVKKDSPEKGQDEAEKGQHSPEKWQHSSANGYDATVIFRSSSEIRSKIEQMSGIRLSQQKLSVSLKKLGFEPTIKRISGQQLRGFWVREIDSSLQTPDIKDHTEPGCSADDLPF